MKYIKQLFCIVMLLLTIVPVIAAEGKSSIDVKNILWGHIKDSYEWHVTNIGKTPISIHLPVIIKTSAGWRVFCSSEFAEEPLESGKLKGYYHGPDNLYIAGSGKYERKIVEIRPDGTEVRPFDISITKTVCVLFIDAILLLVCILIPARWCKKHNLDDPAPKGFVGFIHMFVMYIYTDVIKSALGKETDKYASYLLTCFFFIFIANMMGVIPFPPGGGNLTGNITCTFFLAFCTFLITNLTGTREYWKEIFWPEVPTWLKVPVPIMPFIEFFGVFTKPFALMIRLFANMMAGHAIALSFASIIFIMFGINAFSGTSMTIVSVAMSIFMMLLEILVCFIQALVFTMLSAVFISLAHAKSEKKVEFEEIK